MLLFCSDIHNHEFSYLCICVYTHICVDVCMHGCACAQAYIDSSTNIAAIGGQFSGAVSLSSLLSRVSLVSVWCCLFQASWPTPFQVIFLSAVSLDYR